MSGVTENNYSPNVSLISAITSGDAKHEHMIREVSSGRDDIDVMNFVDQIGNQSSVKDSMDIDIDFDDDEVDEDGSGISLPNIYYDFNKFDFLRPMKRKLAKILLKFRDRSVQPIIIELTNAENKIKSNITSSTDAISNEIDLDFENVIQEEISLKSTTPSYSSKFSIGDYVKVDARTFPGMNKLGGVGKITRVTYRESDDDYVYSVKYTVETGTENKIEEKYVHHHTLENDVTSRRAHIHGRCSTCNSFLFECTCTTKGPVIHVNIERRKSQGDRLRELVDEKIKPAMERLTAYPKSRPFKLLRNKRDHKSMDSPHLIQHITRIENKDDNLKNHSVDNERSNYLQTLKLSTERHRHQTSVLLPKKRLSEENIQPNETSTESLVEEYFFRVVNECLAKNDVYLYSDKIRILNGNERDSVFIQGEGEKKSRMLPKDLRNTALALFMELNEYAGLMFALDLILSFAEKQMIKYERFKPTIVILDKKIDFLTEELQDSNDQKRIAEELLNFSYEVECERLLTARITMDLFNICQNKLDKSYTDASYKSKTISIEKIVAKLMEIERSTKKSIRHLCDLYENIYFCHPFDIDFGELGHTNVYESQCENTSFEYLPRNRKNKNPTKFLKDRSIAADDRHIHASKKLSGERYKTSKPGNSLSHYPKDGSNNGKIWDNSNQNYPNRVTKNKHIKIRDQVKNPITKKARLRTNLVSNDWSGIIPLFESALEKSRFKMHYKGSNIQVLDKRKGVSVEKSDGMGLHTNSVQFALTESDKLQTSIDPKWRNSGTLLSEFNISDNLNPIRASWDECGSAQQDNINQSQQNNTISNNIEFENSSSEKLVDSGLKYLAELKHIHPWKPCSHNSDFVHFLNSNVSSYSDSPLYNLSESTSSLTCNVQNLFNSIIASLPRMKVLLKSSVDVAGVQLIHSENIKRIRSVDYFLSFDSEGSIEILASVRLEWNRLTSSFYLLLDAYDSIYTSLPQLLSLNDVRFDAIACIIFDYYFEMVTIFVIAFKKAQLIKLEMCERAESLIKEVLISINSINFELFSVLYWNPQILSIVIAIIQSNIFSLSSEIMQEEGIENFFLLSISEHGFRSICISIAFLNVYMVANESLLDADNYKELLSNSRQDPIKCIEKISWRFFNLYISILSTCNSLFDMSYLSTFQALGAMTPTSCSAYLNIKPLSNIFLWNMLFLHSFFLQQYQLRKSSNLVPHNWFLLKLIISSFVEDYFTIGDNTTKQFSRLGEFEHQFTRSFSLLTVWSDNIKGLETFLYQIELILTFIKSKGLQLRTTNVKNFESSDRYPNEGGFIKNPKNLIANLIIKQYEKFSFMMSEKFGISSLAFELLTLDSDKSTNTFFESTSSRHLRELFCTVAFSLDNFLRAILQNTKSSGDSAASIRTFKLVKLTMSSFVSKCIQLCDSFEQALLAISIARITVSTLGETTFDDQEFKLSITPAYTNSFIKKWKVVQPSTNSNLSEFVLQGLQYIIHFFLFGPLNISTADLNSQTNTYLFLSNFYRRFVICLGFTSSTLPVFTSNSSTSNVCPLQYHPEYLFEINMLSSVINTSSNFIASLDCELSYEECELVMRIIIDGSVHLLTIVEYGISTRNPENVNIPTSRLMRSALSSLNMLLVSIIKVITKSNQELSQRMKEYVNAVLPRFRTSMGVLKTNLKTLKEETDDSSFLFSNQNSSNSIKLRAEKGSSNQKNESVKHELILSILSILSLNTVFEFLCTELGYTVGKERITTITLKNIEDIFTYISLPSNTISISSSKISDLLLKGYFIFSLLNNQMYIPQGLQSSWSIISITIALKSSIVILSNCLAYSLYPNAHQIVNVSEFIKLFKDSFSKLPNSFSADFRQAIWIYAISSVHLEPNIDNSRLQFEILDSLIKCRRHIAKRATLTTQDFDVDSFLDGWNVQGPIKSSLLSIPVRESVLLFKEIFDDTLISLLRICNHIRTLFSKHLINFNVEFYNQYYGITSCLIYRCSEMNRDRVGQLLKDLLVEIVTSIVKEHLKPPTFDVQTFRLMSRYQLFLPLILRTISTTPFTTSCSKWSVLMSLLFISFIKRFRSSADMNDYQNMVSIWALSLCLKSDADFLVIKNLVSNRDNAANKLFDSSQWSVLQDSLDILSAGIAGSDTLKHSYAHDSCMDEFRAHIFLPDNGSLSRCWTDSIISHDHILKGATFQKKTSSNDRLDDLEYTGLYSIADVLRTDLMARTLHISSKLQSLNIGIRWNFSNNFVCSLYLEEKLHLIGSLLKSLVKSIRYFLGETPMAIDKTWSYMKNFGSSDSLLEARDYDFVVENILKLFIASDSDLRSFNLKMFASPPITSAGLEQIIESLYLALIAEFFKSLELLTTLLQEHKSNQLSTNINDTQSLSLVLGFRKIVESSTACNVYLLELKALIVPQINRYNEANSMSNASDIELDNDLKDLMNKLDAGLSEQRMRDEIIKKRLSGLLFSRLNAGSNCLDHVTSKLKIVVEAFHASIASE